MKHQVKKLIASLLLVSVFFISSCSQLSLLNREPETAEDYKYYGEKYKDAVNAVKFCHKNEENLEDLLRYQKDPSYVQQRDSYAKYYGNRDILEDIDAIVDLMTEYKKLRGQITAEEIKKDDKVYMRMRYSSDLYSTISDHADYCDNLYKYTENLEEFFRKKSVKKNQIKSEYLEGINYLKKLSNIPKIQRAIIDIYSTMQRDRGDFGKISRTGSVIKYDPNDTTVDYTQYYGLKSFESVERQYKYCTYEYNGLRDDVYFCYDGFIDKDGDYKVYSKLGKLSRKEAKVFDEKRVLYNEEIAEIEKNKGKIYNHKERIESLNQSISFLNFVEGKIKYLRFTNKIDDYYSGNFRPFSKSNRDDFEERIREALK